MQSIVKQAGQDSIASLPGAFFVVELEDVLFDLLLPFLD